ncbi:MAG TPA: hypothetical protein VGD22_12385 [Sphingobacteriaceae bacterium]
MYSISTPYFAATGTRHILVFKTNIRLKKDLAIIEKILKKDLLILHWSLDRDDIDKILRIESKSKNSSQIIAAINKAGYFCEELI